MGTWVLGICHNDLKLTAFAILWVAALASTILNNIPLVMAMIPLVEGISPQIAAHMGITDPEMIRAQIAQPLFWALALGACLGGNGTLVGASANVVIAQVANRNDCPITFWSFTKYGFPFMLISLVVASTFLYLRYFMN